MRTPRIVILVAFSVAFLTLLILSFRTPSPSFHADSYTNPSSSSSESLSRTTTTSSSTTQNNAGLFGSFSFTAPLSLFPPTAVISLTDDNTTAFQARPAAFGPPLPKNSLSGQLWIGSGFGDDSGHQGAHGHTSQDHAAHGLTSFGLAPLGTAEGEQGCSDVPGWEDKRHKPILGTGTGDRMEGGGKKKAKEFRARDINNLVMEEYKQGKVRDDGTDDYLHGPVVVGNGAALTEGEKAGGGENLAAFQDSKHADIQSLQESAEIAGKVVLLSRGGCGFLEKVMWAQRRGGVAVIVGDDTRGGPLIQMYARGDTSNVTIPSVFTSHTTAHLLSSLIPPGTYIEDVVDKDGNPAIKTAPPTKKSGKGRKGGKKGSKTATATTPAESAEKSWWRYFGFGSSIGDGSLDPLVVDKWDELEDLGDSSPKALRQSVSKGKTSTKVGQGDNFMIGVQDWRDSDLVNVPAEVEVDMKAKKGFANGRTPERAAALVAESEPKKATNAKSAKAAVVPPANAAAAIHAVTPKSGEADQPGLLNKIFGDDTDIPGSDDRDSDNDDASDPPYNLHEGLWVTLAKTNSATPFFDTLLVLVVSPLVTLTVVYALLLIRSRIRRRRWRAPKSVVQQLPVRTYQTVPASETVSRNPSPQSSSPNTPLLSGANRPRPRSRTTSGLPEPGISKSNSANHGNDVGKKEDMEGKNKVGGGSQWKKYMGRQVECVVCLEEYVDGVSKVMSLPCGHEFHEECITPWLTTRRRTCPICKGDVVRSLERANASGSSSPRYIPYQEDGANDDVQEHAASRSNDSPSASRPSSPGGSDEDVEQGVAGSGERGGGRRENGSGSWLNALTERIGLGGGGPPTTEEDRSR